MIVEYLVVRLTLIMSYIMQQIFYVSISNFSTMFVELTTPYCTTWTNLLVKQRLKLELEMLGGFGKVEV